MIKDFKSFSKNDMTLDDVKKEYIDFYEKLDSCKDFYSNEGLKTFERSYSYSSHESTKSDPDKDFKLVDSYMSKNGWDLMRSRSLIEYCKKFNYDYTEYKNNNYKYAFCAPIDYYLYKLSNKEYLLAGYNLKDLLFSEDKQYAAEETFIRYGYGYHKSKYGKLFIEQSFGTIEKYTEYCSKLLPKYIYDVYFEIFGKIYGDKDEFIDEAFKINKNEVSLSINRLLSFYDIDDDDDPRSYAIEKLSIIAKSIGCKFRYDKSIFTFDL